MDKQATAIIRDSKQIIIAIPSKFVVDDVVNQSRKKKSLDRKSSGVDRPDLWRVNTGR